MGGFGDAIKYLYEKFILRDLLSFVTPGAIIVLIAFLLFLPDLDTLFRYSRSIHWLLYIPLFGLFFMTDFAVQCFGEICTLILFTPIDPRSFRQRLKIFWCNWDKSRMGEEETQKQLADFREATKDNEAAKQQHERFVVLKQMCGNGFLASGIASVLLLVNRWFHQASLILLFIVAFLLLISLFWGHRVSLLRQDAWRKSYGHQGEGDKGDG